MLAWLGEWLSSIVAVVLLAIVVELTLPNSKMLRYSRLVVGLILLLTMLNPLLQWFKVDFHQKLDQGFSIWEKELEGKNARSPSLEEINKQAQKLQMQREAKVADVTKSNIELAILQELKSKTTIAVNKVELIWGWNHSNHAEVQEQLPYVAELHVYVDMHAANHSEESEAKQSPIVDVSIPAVSIEIQEVEPVNNQGDREGKEQTNLDKSTNQELASIANEIVRIISSNWEINANQIFVQAS